MKSLLVPLLFIVCCTSMPCLVQGAVTTGSTTGYFLIESDPSGAEVTFDGVFVGETPLNYPVSPAAVIPHTITVTSDGYYPFTTTYSENPGPGQTIRVFATLSPSTSQGTLVVSSTPQGALITVDGGKGQEAPWTYPEIKSGSHVVQAFLSGYQPYSQIVDVPPQGTVNVVAVLKPLTEVGSLQIKSSPGGANVYVDGIYKGSTATTVGNLAVGSHFVLLKHSGYKDWSGMTNVNQNQLTFLDATMILASEETGGYIQVQSKPTGASVFLDGDYQGITHPGDPLEITGVPPGDHTVTLQLKNYQDFSTRVTIRAGRTERVDATLTPAIGLEESGPVQFISEPSGAYIFIDNTCWGVTPFTVPSLPVGSHSVLLRLTGYQDYQSTLTLTPGQSVQIQAALTPVSMNTPLSPYLAVVSLCIPGFLLIYGRKGSLR